jgi:hypothetical protein
LLVGPITKKYCWLIGAIVGLTYLIGLIEAFILNSWSLAVYAIMYMFYLVLGVLSAIREDARDKSIKRYSSPKLHWAESGYIDFLDKHGNKYWNIKYAY